MEVVYCDVYFDETILATVWRLAYMMQRWKWETLLEVHAVSMYIYKACAQNSVAVDWLLALPDVINLVDI